jgi:hypothetical protein
MRSSKWALVPCLMVLAVAAAGCGSSGAIATGACANAHGHHKIKVAIKMGAVYVSFKHWVSSPLKAGAFKKGSPGRTKALVKAGAALVADAAILNSIRGEVADDKQLCHILTPFEHVASIMAVTGSKLKNGQGTEQELKGASSLLDTVKNAV